jgi:hypothetical protein
VGTVIIRRTGQPPLRIKGEEVVRSASSSNNASPSYGGSVGRSQEVAVYRTESGRYVAAITNLTTWQGEHDTYDAAVFPSIKPCVGYLRERVPAWMLQSLVEGLGEEAMAEEVD